LKKIPQKPAGGENVEGNNLKSPIFSITNWKILWPPAYGQGPPQGPPPGAAPFPPPPGMLLKILAMIHKKWVGYTSGLSNWVHQVEAPRPKDLIIRPRHGLYWRFSSKWSTSKQISWEIERPSAHYLLSDHCLGQKTNLAIACTKHHIYFALKIDAVLLKIPFIERNRTRYW
jgi:hypothetical protein